MLTLYTFLWIISPKMIQIYVLLYEYLYTLSHKKCIFKKWRTAAQVQEVLNINILVH